MASMPTSFNQLPTVSGAGPQPMSNGRIMGWAFALMLLTWPRLIIIGFWIFGNTLGGAFDSWVVPALGFLLLPWTTMGYALMWGIASSAVSGTEWIVVGLALLFDLATWAGIRLLR